MLKKRAADNGFTLIELLVVIAIIALLLSILVPSLAKIKWHAKIVICKTNFRQWGIAARLYAQDNKGRFPMDYIEATCGENVHDISSEFVRTMIHDYDIPGKMFYCPAGKESGLKYPGSEVDVEELLLTYPPHLSTVPFAWWVPRTTPRGYWFPCPPGEDPTQPPKTGAPRRDTDGNQSTKPIMTDVCYGSLSQEPTLENIYRGGHKLRGKIESVNSLFGDGHVEIHKTKELKMQHESRQMYHWW